MLSTAFFNCVGRVGRMKLVPWICTSSEFFQCQKQFLPPSYSPCLWYANLGQRIDFLSLLTVLCDSFILHKLFYAQRCFIHEQEKTREGDDPLEFLKSKYFGFFSDLFYGFVKYHLATFNSYTNPWKTLFISTLGSSSVQFSLLCQQLANLNWGETRRLSSSSLTPGS